MADVFEKCSAWKEVQLVKIAGHYPYYRVIEQNDGTEVVIGGKRLIMACSNNYLGLANHPRLTEAAKQAIDQYGSDKPDLRFSMELKDFGQFARTGGFEVFKKIVAEGGVVKAIATSMSFSAKAVSAAPPALSAALTTRTSCPRCRATSRPAKIATVR